MPKISVVTLDKARRVAAPESYSGLAGALAYYDDAESPLHLHLHEIGPGELLRIEESATDRLANVWR
jgi:hypothetical protein